MGLRINDTQHNTTQHTHTERRKYEAEKKRIAKEDKIYDELKETQDIIGVIHQALQVTLYVYSYMFGRFLALNQRSKSRNQASIWPSSGGRHQSVAVAYIFIISHFICI